LSVEIKEMVEEGWGGGGRERERERVCVCDRGNWG